MLGVLERTPFPPPPVFQMKSCSAQLTFGTVQQRRKHLGYFTVKYMYSIVKETTI